MLSKIILIMLLCPDNSQHKHENHKISYTVRQMQHQESNADFCTMHEILTRFGPQEIIYVLALSTFKA